MCIGILSLCPVPPLSIVFTRTSRCHFLANFKLEECYTDIDNNKGSDVTIFIALSSQKPSRRRMFSTVAYNILKLGERTVTQREVAHKHMVIL
jgi:hypothetical protein